MVQSCEDLRVSDFSRVFNSGPMQSPEIDGWLVDGYCLQLVPFITLNIEL